MSPRRLDANLKIDQKTREQLEDGSRIYVKIDDPVRGESDWSEVKAKFLKLPVNLSFKCSANNSPAATINETAKPVQTGTADKNVTEPTTARSVVPTADLTSEQQCELTGDLSMIESYFVPNEKMPEDWQPVGITSEKISFSKKVTGQPFYIKLRGYTPSIKINSAALQNTTVSNTANR